MEALGGLKVIVNRLVLVGHVKNFVGSRTPHPFIRSSMFVRPNKFSLMIKIVPSNLKVGGLFSTSYTLWSVEDLLEINFVL